MSLIRCECGTLKEFLEKCPFCDILTHKCPNWDGLEIGPTDPEFDSCTCYSVKEEESG